MLGGISSKTTVCEPDWSSTETVLSIIALSEKSSTEFILLLAVMSSHQDATEKNHEHAEK